MISHEMNLSDQTSKLINLGLLEINVHHILEFLLNQYTFEYDTPDDP